jgi:predicted Zn-dependent peptidase
MDSFEHKTLSNDTDIYTIGQEGTEATTLLVMLPVGSRYEPDNLLGASHFIEHLMFKGTEKRPTTLDITKEIDKYGADYNAFTSREYTGYYIKADSDYIEQAADILSDVLYNSKFESDEMEKEKSVIQEEISMYKDNPLMYVNKVFSSVMYKNSPLDHDIAGTRETVQNLAREEVLDYKDYFYDSSNFNIIAAGSVDDRVSEILAEKFGQDTNQPEIELNNNSAEYGPTEKEERINILQKDSDQAQVMLGWPAYSYGDEKNFALSIVDKIMGGNMSSKLFTRIREQMGLAYSISSGFAKYQDVGHFYVKMGLDPENINKAISEVKNIIDEMKQDGLENQEIEDAKKSIQGGTTLDMEDSKSVANWYGKRATLSGEILTPKEKIEKINSVTETEINQVIDDVFSNKMRVGIIGNVTEGDINF